MAESRDDPTLYWFEPKLRGVLPLDGFHISHSTARSLRRDGFEPRFDENFAAVVQGCADRPETWINAPLLMLYQELFEAGAAHSVELYHQGQLVGGVFGIALGGAFFGESMFSRRTNASKIALAYTVDRLRQGGFSLFDTQYLTPHLASLGGIEIPKAEYKRQLATALAQRAHFEGPAPTPQLLLQRMTQIS